MFRHFFSYRGAVKSLITNDSAASLRFGDRKPWPIVESPTLSPCLIGILMMNQH